MMRARLQEEAGFTLVEMLVALVLGLTVILLCSTGLHSVQRGLLLVDHATQLQDRERLVRDLITRVLQQAGADVNAPGSSAPLVLGWDNAVYQKPANGIAWHALPQALRNGSRPVGCGAVRDSSCLNGSDILGVRVSGDFPGMTRCDGSAARGSAIYLVFINRDSRGEPSLSCTYPVADGNWAPPTPLLEGVESLQFLYGLRPANPALTHIERWQSAADIEISGDPAATLANWRRVRAVRVGVVLRSDRHAGDPPASTLYPLGQTYANAAGNDPGAHLRILSDRRLRRVVQWTVVLPFSPIGSS